MLRSHRTIFLLALAAMALAAVGCGGDDPAGPAANTLNLDASTAEQFTLEALTMVNDVVTMVPEFADGSFVGAVAADRPLAKVAGDSLEWAPDQQAWVYAYAGPLVEMDPPNHWDMSLDLWLQYRDGQDPLQTPLGATVMQLIYGMSMDIHQVDPEQGTVDLTYDMGMDVTVDYLSQGVYGIGAHGDAYVAVSQVTPQASQSGTFTMDWTVDVTTAAGGCPSGTATVKSQAWTMAATYDGQGNVDWTLTGPNWRSTGKDALACGQPVN